MPEYAGALFTQTTALASLDVFAFERSADLMLVLVIGGTGYLYGGLIGAVVFRMLQEFFSNLTPQYWQFWIGLVLVVIVLVGRARCIAGRCGRRTWSSGSSVAARPSSPFPRARRHEHRAWKQKGWKSSSAGSRSRATSRSESSRAPATR